MIIADLRSEHEFFKVHLEGSFNFANVNRSSGADANVSLMLHSKPIYRCTSGPRHASSLASQNSQRQQALHTESEGITAIMPPTSNNARQAKKCSRMSCAATASLMQRAAATGKLCTVIVGNGESDEDATTFAARLVRAGLPYVAVLHGGMASILQQESSHFFLMVTSRKEDYF